jgi:tetratricopeptide (TPR) repeat protein
MELIEKLRQQVAQHPDSIIFMRLAETYRVQGKLKDAAIVLAAGVKRNPKYIKARKKLAEVCFEAGKYDLAEREFKKFLKAVPEDTPALLMLAQSCQRTGKDAEALEHYQHILEYDPFEDAAKKGIEMLGGTVDAEAPQEMTARMEPPGAEPAEDAQAQEDEDLADSTMVMEAPVFDSMPKALQETVTIAPPTIESAPEAVEPAHEQPDEPEEETKVMDAPASASAPEIIEELPKDVLEETHLDMGEETDAAVEHFESAQADEDDADATMVMEAPAFDTDTVNEPTEYEEDAGVAVEHFENVQADDDDADATMVMEAPAFDTDAVADAPTEYGADAGGEVEHMEAQPSSEETESEADSFSGEDAPYEYDENPDGDLIVGELDMEMDMAQEGEEDTGFGSDEFLSGGIDGFEDAEHTIEHGAVDYEEEPPANEIEVGEIDMDEGHKSVSDLEVAAEKIAEEVFVESGEAFEEESDEHNQRDTVTMEPDGGNGGDYLDEEPDATVVMEVPSHMEPVTEQPVEPVELIESVELIEPVESVESVESVEVEEVVESEVVYEDDTDVSVTIEPSAFRGPEVTETVKIEVPSDEPYRAIFEEADGFVASEEYFRAMETYNSILKDSPDYAPALQRVQELKMLLKALGKDSELIEHNLDKFLSSIKRRRDEFYANP